jgi:hypothetical protein
MVWDRLRDKALALTDLGGDLDLGYRRIQGAISTLGHTLARSTNADPSTMWNRTLLPISHALVATCANHQFVSAPNLHKS